MATYILFWNPAISSYNMARFKFDFEHDNSVGNWSFYEHEKVKYDDNFFMVRCGEGKTGIVMQGKIESSCYEGADWSPKGRRPIYYADIYPSIVINSETAAQMLTPDILTEAIPDFDWYGGHSGRLLDTKSANILHKLWVEYLNNNTSLFEKDAKKYGYGNNYYILNERPILSMLNKRYGSKCECCGYDYAEYFDKDILKKEKITVPFKFFANAQLPRAIYRVCDNCMNVPEDILISRFHLNELKK